LQIINISLAMSFVSSSPPSTNASDARSFRSGTSGIQDPSLPTEQSSGGQSVDQPILIDGTWEVFKQEEEEEFWSLEVGWQYRGWKYQSWGVFRSTEYPTEQEAKNAFVKFMREEIVKKHDDTREENTPVTWEFQELQFELFVMNKPKA
jgi:hypothetical protein